MCSGLRVSAGPSAPRVLIQGEISVSVTGPGHRTTDQLVSEGRHVVLCCVDPVKGSQSFTSWWEKLSVLSRWGRWSRSRWSLHGEPAGPPCGSGAVLIQWAGTEVNTGVTDLPPQTRWFCPPAWRLADELAVICVSCILSFSVRLWRLPPERFLMGDSERRDRLIAANMSPACRAAGNRETWSRPSGLPQKTCWWNGAASCQSGRVQRFKWLQCIMGQICRTE